MNPKYNQSYFSRSFSHGVQIYDSFTREPLGQDQQSLNVVLFKGVLPQYKPGHRSTIVSTILKVNDYADKKCIKYYLCTIQLLKIIFNFLIFKKINHKFDST